MTIKPDSCAGLLNVCDMCGINHLAKMKNMPLHQIYQMYESESVTVLCDYLFNLTQFAQIHIVPAFRMCFVLQSFPRSDVRNCVLQIPGSYQEYQGMYHVMLKFTAPNLDNQKQKCLKSSDTSEEDPLDDTLHYNDDSNSKPIGLYTTSERSLEVKHMTLFQLSRCIYYNYFYALRVMLPAKTMQTCAIYEPVTFPFTLTQNSFCYMLVCRPGGSSTVDARPTRMATLSKYHNVTKLFPSYLQLAGYVNFDKSNVMIKLRCSNNDPSGMVYIHVLIAGRLSHMTHYLISMDVNDTLRTFTVYNERYTIIIDNFGSSCSAELFYEWTADIVHHSLFVETTMMFTVTQIVTYNNVPINMYLFFSSLVYIAVHFSFIYIFYCYNIY